MFMETKCFCQSLISCIETGDQERLHFPSKKQMDKYGENDKVWHSPAWESGVWLEHVSCTKNVISSQNISPERGGGSAVMCNFNTNEPHTHTHTHAHSQAEGLISVSLLEQPSSSCMCCDFCLSLSFLVWQQKLFQPVMVKNSSWATLRFAAFTTFSVPQIFYYIYSAVKTILPWQRKYFWQVCFLTNRWTCQQLTAISGQCSRGPLLHPLLPVILLWSLLKTALKSSKINMSPQT